MTSLGALCLIYMALSLLIAFAAGWVAASRRAYRHGFEDGLELAESDTAGWLDTEGPFGDRE